MSISDTEILLPLMVPFPEHVQETALQLRAFVWERYPDCNELIYDSYNALGACFSLSDKLSDAFVSFAMYSKHVNFGLQRGSQIGDPEKRFSGSGSYYRHLRVDRMEDFPVAYVEARMAEAYALAWELFKGEDQVQKGLTMLKAQSDKRRR